jgi:hypothetical protein
MANAAFSPKNFRAFFVAENTNGTPVTLTSGNVCHELDIDSVVIPTFTPNQSLDVRNGIGRVFNINDFFQDNKSMVTEISLSGTLHNSTGHVGFLKNIMLNADDPLAIGYNHNGGSGKYATSTVTNATFTLVLAAPDATDGYNLVFAGCMCTNFQISADINSDGGKYTWSATVSTGLVPTLENTDTLSVTAYSGSPISLATASAIKFYSLTPVVNSFSLTIDSPAVYSGTSSSGYHSFSRGAETSVTADCLMKYDSVTRPLLDDFVGQVGGGHDAADAFIVTQGTAANFSIAVPSGVLTNAALSEGDIMMIEGSLKAAGLGSGNVLTIDVA